MTDTTIVKLSVFNSIIKGLDMATKFFLGIYLVSIGFSGIQIGTLFALGTIINIITILPSGFSNDTVRSKNLITIAITLVGIYYFGMSQTNSFYAILLLFLLGAIGMTLYISSSDSLFYKTSAGSGVRQKIGLFNGLNYLMIAAGMITAGYALNLNFSFEKIFFVVGIIFFLFAILSCFILPSSQTIKFEILNYKKDIFKPKVLLFMSIVFLFAIHFGAEITSYGLFLENNLHLNKFQMGLYMGIAIMMMGPTAIFIGYKQKAFKIKNVLIFGLLLSGLFHILMTTKIVQLSFLFRVIHEIGDAGVFFFMYYGISQLFDLKRIGGNAGVFQLTTNLGGTLGAFIFGPIGANFGYHLPLIISGTSTLLAFILALQFIHHFDHQ